MPRASSYDCEPEILEMEIPPGRRGREPRAEVSALIAMAVSKKEPLYFRTTPGISIKKLASLVGSWIVNAKRKAPTQSYAKRMVEFDGEEGVAVWRLK